MTSLNTLREERAAKIDKARALSGNAERENRDLSDSERAEWNALKTDIEALEARIARKQSEDEWDRRAQSPGQPQFNPTDLRGYSIGKALTEAMAGNLTGLEREASDELSRGREARKGGMPCVTIPTAILLESRALTTTAPVAGPGGALVGTELAAMTDRRRPALKIQSLGANVLSGLTGNLDLPGMTDSGKAYWVGEHANTTRSDAKFAKKTMGPKTVSAEYEVSRRMLLQSNTALDPILRADLGFMLAQALDKAAILGGGANEPTGIMEDAGVAELTAAAFSSLITAGHIEELDLDDVTGTRAFLTHPKVMGMARRVQDADGRIIPLAELFHGERVELSTQVPSNLGTGTDKAALIYGEWASLYLGYWSGVDILVNPYHADVASKGGALLHAFLDADVLVRHPEAFDWRRID